jgi:hypothetical protein
MPPRGFFGFCRVCSHHGNQFRIRYFAQGGAAFVFKHISRADCTPTNFIK